MHIHRLTNNNAKINKLEWWLEILQLNKETRFIRNKHDKITSNLKTNSTLSITFEIFPIPQVVWLCFLLLSPYKMTQLWRHNACSSILGTREKLPVWSESALPVTEKEGKGEGNMSIGPWTKYGHANLTSFCPCTNGRCSMNCMHRDVTRQCISRGAKYLKSRVILLHNIVYCKECL